MSDSQPNAKPTARKDPKSRPVHAASFGGNILNADPAKHYVWVSKQDGGENNHEYYSSIGYEIERFDPKAPLKVFMVKSPVAGQPIFFRDMVLMSCSKERKAEIDQFGPDGSSGYNLFGQWMAKIQKNQIEAPNRRINGLREIVEEMDGFDDGVFR